MQHPSVLSRRGRLGPGPRGGGCGFAGAAVELADAILTNPFHIDGLAADLDRALRMPLEERRAVHRRLVHALEDTSPTAWASRFLARLDRAGGARDR